MGEEVGPGGQAAEGVGEEEGEGDSGAIWLPPMIVVDLGSEEVEAEELGWKRDENYVGAARGKEAVWDGDGSMAAEPVTVSLAWVHGS